MLSHKIFLGFIAVRIYKCLSLPSLGFPIDAQFPPVAVIGHQFYFSFSSRTFTSPLDIHYAARRLPSWLHFEPLQRTFSGTPSQGDVGNVEFDLQGFDDEGTTSVQVRLVVLAQSTIQGDQDALIRQLAEGGTFSPPSTFMVYPETSFNLNFGRQIFHKNDQSLDFYATSEDHTPLPTWLRFDNEAVSLVGTSPSLLTPQSSPQRFDFCLLASQIPNFSQAALCFEIAVTNNVLVFMNSSQSFNVITGQRLSIPPLLNQLRYNQNAVQRSQIVSVESKQPDWLILQPNDFSFNGIVPSTFDNALFRLSVMDQGNNLASVDIQLTASGASETGKPQDFYLGMINVTAGQWFNYTFADIVADSKEPIFELSTSLGSAKSWLNFDESNMSLQGLVPRDLGGNELDLAVIVKYHEQVLKVYHLSLLTQSTFNNTDTRPSNDGTLTSSPSPISTAGGIESVGEHPQSMNKKTLVLVIIASIVLAFVACLLVMLFRKRLQGRRVKEVPPVETSTQTSSSTYLVVLTRGSSEREASQPRHSRSTPGSLGLGEQGRPLVKRRWPFGDAQRSGSLQTRSSRDAVFRTTYNPNRESAQSQESRLDVSGRSTIRGSFTMSSFTPSTFMSRIYRRPAANGNIASTLQETPMISKRSMSQIRPLTNALSPPPFVGRRVNGLGHGTSTHIPVQNFQQATLRQVPISPLSPLPESGIDAGRLQVFQPLDQSLTSWRPDDSLLVEQSKTTESGTSDYHDPSFSRSSSGVMRNVQDRAYQNPKFNRRHRTSTSFSIWEDEEWMTESRTSRSGNWQIQSGVIPTSQASFQTSEREVTARAWYDGSSVFCTGLARYETGLRTQQSEDSQPHSLRFI